MTSRKDQKGRVLRTGESQRKDGTYQYRYTDTLGKRKYVYAKTLNELRVQSDKINRDKMDGINSDGQTITLDEMFEEFLRMKKNQVRDTTIRTYSHLRGIIQKYPISKVPIAKIRPSILKEWLFQIVDDGYRQGTARSIKHILHGVFDLALSDDLIRKNPCHFKLFFKDKEHSKKFALDLGQQKALLDFIRENERFNKHYDLVVCLLGTGMRISELLGITIKDVNFQTNRIHVNHQLIREIESDITISEPKSEKGNRFIPMTAEVSMSIRRLILSRNTTRELIIDGYYGFIFVNPVTSLPYTRAGIRYILDEIIKEYNEQHSIHLPHLSPHIFRHTFASTMIQSGMSAKTLQHILGHANVATTLDTYTHMFEDYTATEMAKAEEFISSTR